MNFDRIGRYEVIKEIGRGGMSTVFVAHDPAMNRQVAIKVLPQELMHDPNFRARFEREARTVAGLEHPSIVPIYDFGEVDGQPYFVMRLMSGGALSDRLEAGSIPLAEVVSILKRVAQGLDYAHKEGVIHRDLKPANILFDQNGEPYLSDFGIAKLAESGATLTGNAIIGTPAYMSPEQGRGETDVDGRSDIYSLGVVMFHMMTGNVPYEADTPMGQVVKHMTAPLPFLADIDPDLPPQLQSVINRAMAKRKLTRYATAGEMVADLEAAIEGRLGEVVLPPSGAHRPITPPGGAATPTPTRPRQPGSVAGPSTPRPTRVGPQTPRPTRAGIADTPPPPSDNAPTTVQPVKKRSPWGAIIGAVVVLGLLAAGIIYGLPLLGISIPPFVQAAQPTKTEAVAALPSNTPEPSSTPTKTPEPTDQSETTPGAGAGAGEATETPTPTESEPTLTPTSQPVSPLPPGPVIGGADLVAFVKSGDIWIANLDGTEKLRLTNTGGIKEGLNWTPDGMSIVYIAGRLVQKVGIMPPHQVDTIMSFNWAEYVSSFAISPDHKYVAISLSAGLFILPYDEDTLSQIKRRDQLFSANACIRVVDENNPNTTKVVRWSGDSKQVSIVVVVSELGRKVDMIRTLNVATCGVTPQSVDSFPSGRFTIPGFANTPIIETFGWDGSLVLAMNISGLNGSGLNAFGEIYTYNLNSRTSSKIVPLYDGKTERCCYRDFAWSPDGDYFMFLFQDNRILGDSELYYVQYGSIGTGQVYTPLPFGEGFLNSRTEKLYPALRPALSTGR